MGVEFSTVAQLSQGDRLCTLDALPACHRVNEWLRFPTADGCPDISATKQTAVRCYYGDKGLFIQLKY